MKFLTGLMFIALGIALMKFRYKIYEFTGEWGWASKYLGGNGTIVAIVLFGMFFVGLGTAYALGMVDLSNGGLPKSPEINVSK